MTIEKIDCRSNFQGATITLDYNDLREIASGLSELDELSQERSGDFYSLYRDMAFLLDIVKNGCIDDFTVKMLKTRQSAVEKAGR